MALHDTIQQLSRQITAHRTGQEQLDNYYKGGQRLAAMGLAIPPKLRQLQTVVNWPRVYVDSLANRMSVEGFRLAGDTSTDSDMWDWWQANNLDEWQKLAYVETLVQGRCYITVDYDEEDPSTPTIRVESPRHMFAETDPRTRRVTRALRHYVVQDENGQQQQRATLYEPETTTYAALQAGTWVELSSYEHKLGRVPVVPMVNRARVEDRLGESEMTDVIGLTDAACRLLTGLQAAQELQALPQRYLLGITEDAFKNADGQTKTAWEVYTGAIFAAEDQGVTAGQWSAADLRQFNDVVKMYGSQIASVTGLPPQYLGISTDNPASADAIRMQESRLVMTVESKSVMFSGAWEEAMRLGMLIVGKDAARARRLETVWRDPSTPTRESLAVAIKGLYDSGIYDLETALERLGESPEQVRKILDRHDKTSMNRLAASLGLTNEPDSVQRGEGVDSAAPGGVPAGSTSAAPATRTQ